MIAALRNARTLPRLCEAGRCGLKVQPEKEERCGNGTQNGLRYWRPLWLAREWAPLSVLPIRCDSAVQATRSPVQSAAALSSPDHRGASDVMSRDILKTDKTTGFGLTGSDAMPRSVMSRDKRAWPGALRGNECSHAPGHVGGKRGSVAKDRRRDRFDERKGQVAVNGLFVLVGGVACVCVLATSGSRPYRRAENGLG